MGSQQIHERDDERGAEPMAHNHANITKKTPVKQAVAAGVASCAVIACIVGIAIAGGGASASEDTGGTTASGNIQYQQMDTAGGNAPRTAPGIATENTGSGAQQSIQAGASDGEEPVGDDAQNDDMGRARKEISEADPADVSTSTTISPDGQQQDITIVQQDATDDSGNEIQDTPSAGLGDAELVVVE